MISSENTANTKVESSAKYVFKLKCQIDLDVQHLLHISTFVRLHSLFNSKQRTIGSPLGSRFPCLNKGYINE